MGKRLTKKTGNSAAKTLEMQGPYDFLTLRYANHVNNRCPLFAAVPTLCDSSINFQIRNRRRGVRAVSTVGGYIYIPQRYERVEGKRKGKKDTKREKRKGNSRRNAFSCYDWHDKYAIIDYWQIFFVIQLPAV